MGFLRTGLTEKAGFILHGAEEAVISLEPAVSITDTDFDSTGCAVARDPTSTGSYILALDANTAIGFATYEPYPNPASKSLALFKNGLEFVAKTGTGTGIIAGDLISVSNGLFVIATSGMLAIGVALENAIDHTGGYGTFAMVIKFSTTKLV